MSLYIMLLYISIIEISDSNKEMVYCTWIRDRYADCCQYLCDLLSHENSSVQVSSVHLNDSHVIHGLVWFYSLIYLMTYAIRVCCANANQITLFCCLKSIFQLISSLLHKQNLMTSLCSIDVYHQWNLFLLTGDVNWEYSKASNYNLRIIN